MHALLAFGKLLQGGHSVTAAGSQVPYPHPLNLQCTFGSPSWGMLLVALRVTTYCADLISRFALWCSLAKLDLGVCDTNNCSTGHASMQR